MMKEDLSASVVRFWTDPAPEGDPDGGLQIMVTTLEADDYLGKVAIGRVTRGTVKQGMAVAITDGEKIRTDHVGQLFNWQGMKRTPVAKQAWGISWRWQDLKTSISVKR